MREFLAKYTKLWQINVVLLIALLQIVNSQWGWIDDYLSPQAGKIGGMILQVLITVFSVFGI